MRSSRHRRYVSPQLEAFEARQLLSASVAQIFTPHYALGEPAGAHWANLGAIAGISSEPWPIELHATVAWDNGAPIDAGYGGDLAGNWDVSADLPNKTLGTHTAHVEFWVSPPSNPDQRLDAVSFDTTAVVDPNSPNGTTIQAMAHQKFSGYVGTIYGYMTPDEILHSGRTILQWLSVSWGDSHTSVPGGGFGSFSADGTIALVSTDADSVTVVPNPNGGSDIYATHTYAVPGTYHISISGGYVNRPGGDGVQAMYIMAGNFDAQSTAIVAPVVGEQLVSGATVQAVAGHNLAGYLGTIQKLSLPGGSDLIVGGSAQPETAIVNGTTESVTLGLAVNWGDGNTDNAVYLVANGTGGYDVYGYHTYLKGGNYQISADLTGSPTPNPASDGSFFAGPDPFEFLLQSTAQISASGDSSLPQLSAANGIFNGKVGSFTGDGSTSIDWGDGSTGTAAVVPTGESAFDAYAAHKYNADGTYLLTFFSRGSHSVYFAEVSVTGDISSGDAGSPIIPTAPTAPSDPTLPGGSTDTPTVGSPKPKVPVLGQMQFIAGKSFSGLLGQASVPLGLIVGGNKVSIDWGDGTRSTTGSAVHQKGTAWRLHGGHTYARAGHYIITVTLLEPGRPPLPGDFSHPIIVIDTLQLEARVAAAPRRPRGHR